MALYVQKFGGTSVGSVERIKAVAESIYKYHMQGHHMVIVLSAMSGETNRLFGLGQKMAANPNRREMAVLVSTGEQVTIALLAIRLNEMGCEARSYLANQVGIRTSSGFEKARIESIDVDRIKTDLENNRIVVVAGFQGVDTDGNITILGRGGSDTTAVALAAALRADECQIYTDVDGVYTTDPRVEPKARRLDRLTFDEMLELSGQGAKVLQIRSVEFASKYNVPLRVLSSFEEGRGTLIIPEEQIVEQPLISGVAFNRDEAKITILAVPDQPGIASQVFGAIADADIEVDIIVQNISEDGKTDMTFTLHRSDFDRAKKVVDDVSVKLKAKGVVGDQTIAKISLVGVGMRSHSGVAGKMFRALADESINIQMISTSEIKISVIVDEKYVELGVRALHDTFRLESDK